MLKEAEVGLKHTRECVAIEVDTSLPGLRVKQVLERLKEMRGLPASITVDNGPEFAGRAYAVQQRHHPVVAVPMDGGNRCEFSVSTKELTRRRAEEPQLCEALHQGRKQAHLTFSGVPRMGAEELRYESPRPQ